MFTTAEGSELVGRLKEKALRSAGLVLEPHSEMSLVHDGIEVRAHQIRIPVSCSDWYLSAENRWHTCSTYSESLINSLVVCITKVCAIFALLTPLSVPLCSAQR